jgi:hypothetical protein
MTNPIELPRHNEVVIATLKSESGTTVTAELIHVDEDDLTWRTADDNSELNEWAWSVVSWVYKD